MDRTQILIPNKAERESLIVALVNSGYTVRKIERKCEDQPLKIVQEIEYWKEEEL